MAEKGNAVFSVKRRYATLHPEANGTGRQLGKPRRRKKFLMKEANVPNTENGKEGFSVEKASLGRLPAETRKARRHTVLKQMKANYFLYLFLLPATAYLLIFCYGPITAFRSPSRIFTPIWALRAVRG